MALRTSPCTGYCEINNKTKVCLGCLRTIEEVCSWQSYNESKRLNIMKSLNERRNQSTHQQGFIDQMGRKSTFTGQVKTIVSLVPSITQTLYDLGLQSRVLGVTAFCPSGPEGFSIKKIGGTKKILHEEIEALNPDIIVGNKEENTKDMIDTLSRKFPVWMSDIINLTDGLKMIEMLGEILGSLEIALHYSSQVMESLPKTDNILRGRCIYLIWKKPFMAAGNHTFINSWLEHLGFENLFSNSDRYPKTSLEEIVHYQPEVLFLPSEPYNFSAKDQSDFSRLLPKSIIIRVPGEHFTWFGTSMVPASGFFEKDLPFILGQ